MTRPSLQFLWCFSVVLLSLLKTTVSTPIFEEGPLFKRANSHYRRTSPSASQTAGALPVHSLLPAIRPGQQLSSIDSLKLTKHIELYYEGARNGNTATTAMVMVPDLLYPALTIEYTNLMKKFECSSDEVTITFDCASSFNVAVADWKNYPSGFILITNRKCCGTHNHGERTFILVTSIEYDEHKLKIKLKTRIIDLKQTVDPKTEIKIEVSDWDLGGPNGFDLNTENGYNIPDNADFDVVLDDIIGYLDLEDPAYWSQLLPGVPGLTRDDFLIIDGKPVYNENGGLTPRSIWKRSWLSKAFHSVVHAATSVVKAVVNTVVKKVVKPFIDIMKPIISLLDPFKTRTLTLLKTSLSFSNVAGNTQTPWGKGLELYHALSTSSSSNGSVSIYCVDCGVRAGLKSKATITFTYLRGITGGSITADGLLHLGFGLGVVATYNHRWVFIRQIFAIPLSPLAIPGLLVLGPQVSLSAGADFAVMAYGQLLAGISIDWDAVHIGFDIGNIGSSSASGFSPRVTPIFKASGEIELDSNAYLLLKLEFGVDILNGLFHKSVALVEKPNIEVTAFANFSTVISLGLEMEPEIVKREVEADVVARAMELNVLTKAVEREVVARALDGCNGVEVFGNFTNRVYFDILGARQYSILNLQGPTFGPYCINKRSEFDHDVFTIPATEWVERSIDIFYPAPAVIESRGPVSTDSTINFTQLFTPDKEYTLQHTENGNLHLVPPGKVQDNDATGYFAMSDGNIIGDSTGRFLHAYVDTLQLFGVSRLRLSKPERLPRTSVLINLVPQVSEDPTKPPFFIAFTSANEAFFPVVCYFINDVQKQYPKVFLSPIADDGFQTLLGGDVLNLVTGNEVGNCAFLAFGSGVI